MLAKDATPGMRAPRLANSPDAERGPERVGLVGDFHHELDVSGSEQRAGYLSEVGVLNAGVRLVEGVTVECVEHLTAEVQLDPLGDRDGLVDAEVLVVEGEATDVSRVARHVAEDIRNVGSWSRVGIRESGAIPVAGLAGAG